MSLFSDLKQPPLLEVLFLIQLYNNDLSEDKINLRPGVYKDDNGEPYVLPVVGIAENILANDNSFSNDYVPTLGIESFREAATRLLLGAESPAIKEKRAFGVQCLSGNGSLVVGFQFLSEIIGRKIVYVSEPTWDNHELLLKCIGVQEIRKYRYWSKSICGLDFEGMIEDLRNAPEESVITLHACAHNPTGCDPNQEQWKQIFVVIKDRKLFPFFDAAYQGFATGEINKDAWAVRYFASQGIELFCAQSFAKNFGLYNERVGNLTVILNTPDYVDAVKSQLALNIKGMYSSPPSHGARIVSYVLNNPELYEQWLGNVKVIAERIIKLRQQLRKFLELLGTPGDWSHITKQTGMFSFTNLTEKQVSHLIHKYHIYLFKSGRISMCLATSRLDYLAKAIHDSIVNVK